MTGDERWLKAMRAGDFPAGHLFRQIAKALREIYG